MSSEIDSGALPPRPGFGFARRHGATVVGYRDQQALVAYRPGVRPEVLAELRRHCGRPLQLQPHGAAEFERLIRDLYEGGSGSALVAADLEGSSDLNAIAEALPEPEDLLESEDDAPIIRLINALLSEAIKLEASDIHIEPFENRLLVRFRVDGVLREVLAPQKAVASAVVSRIKVMAKLDIAEKRLPQDGRIGLRIAGRPVDVRVSTIPSGHGERVVLRLLDKQAGRLDLGQLGMDVATLGHMDRMIKEPHGMLQTFHSDALVLFGATGDLAAKKIFPGLLTLVARGKLSCPVVGVAREPLTIEQFRERVYRALKSRGGPEQRSRSPVTRTRSVATPTMTPFRENGPRRS